jgi:hypothetical protein
VLPVKRKAKHRVPGAPAGNLSRLLDERLGEIDLESEEGLQTVLREVASQTYRCKMNYRRAIAITNAIARQKEVDLPLSICEEIVELIGFHSANQTRTFSYGELPPQRDEEPLLVHRLLEEHSSARTR